MWVLATSTRFRFHVIKLIRCDRTCQQSTTIINKEKSQFTPNSPLSHSFLLIFCLKQSSRRDFSQHVKISFIKNDTISVTDTLIKCTRFAYVTMPFFDLFPLCLHDLLVFKTLFFIKDTLFFYKNIFYKNIDAEICEILRIL